MGDWHGAQGDERCMRAHGSPTHEALLPQPEPRAAVGGIIIA